MATKALNFKMEESEIEDMKQVAEVYHMTITGMIKEALQEYMQKMKDDPFYRLTANVQEAGKKESVEILDAVGQMTDDEMTIVSTERISI